MVTAPGIASLSPPQLGRRRYRRGFLLPLSGRRISGSFTAGESDKHIRPSTPCPNCMQGEAAWKKRLAMCMDEAGRLESQLRFSEERCVSLEAKNKELSTSVESITKERNQSVLRVSELEKICAKEKQFSKNKDQQIVDLRAQVEEMRAQIESLQPPASRNQGTQTIHTGSILPLFDKTKIEKVFNVFNTNMERLSKKFHRSMGGKMSKVARIKIQVGELANRIKCLVAKHGNARRELRNTLSTIETHASEVEVLKMQAKTDCASKNTAQSELVLIRIEKDKEIALLQEELRASTKEMFEFAEQVKTLRLRIALEIEKNVNTSTEVQKKLEKTTTNFRKLCGEHHELKTKFRALQSLSALQKNAAMRLEVEPTHMYALLKAERHKQEFLSKRLNKALQQIGNQQRRVQHAFDR